MFIVLVTGSGYRFHRCLFFSSHLGSSRAGTTGKASRHATNRRNIAPWLATCRDHNEWPLVAARSLVASRLAGHLGKSAQTEAVSSRLSVCPTGVTCTVLPSGFRSAARIPHHAAYGWLTRVLMTHTVQGSNALVDLDSFTNWKEMHCFAVEFSILAIAESLKLLDNWFLCSIGQDRMGQVHPMVTCAESSVI